MEYKIAVINSNVLSSIALRTMLEDVIPNIDIMIFSSVEDFQKVFDDSFAHLFVDATIVFNHLNWFQQIRSKVVVLTENTSSIIQNYGFRIVDISVSEKELIKSLILLHNTGHPHGHARKIAENNTMVQLSAREIDVLKLIVKGLYSKEIADELNISLATVAFHRNNLAKKIGSRSIGRQTIYAIMHGIVKIEEI